jgi:hypothetical protein
MPRVEADVCITLKRRGMKTHRIELIRLPVGRRFRVRTDGKLSSKLPEATATEVARVPLALPVLCGDGPFATQHWHSQWHTRTEPPRRFLGLRIC